MDIPTRDKIEISPELSLSVEEVISDYRIVYKSRQASLIGRKEVLTGKAKFGIFGDGKELPQVAMAKFFQPGDIRSGYYRDQTFSMAKGIQDIKEFFAQLYADTDLNHEPSSAGRQMNSHFATRTISPEGQWKDLTKLNYSFADISPTAGQMPRMAGLSLASKLYRESPVLQGFTQFSENGNEVVFGTIGNASCAEGHFWETINAVGVMKAPLVMSVWDDDYGISVPNYYQITKSSISEVLKGFQREGDSSGYEIFVVEGWDYAKLCATYQKAAAFAREEHVPCLVHVIELTQPQGHSTSGSHERYKSQERLTWEREYDCMKKMREWIIESGMATEEEMDGYEKADLKEVRTLKREAWEAYHQPIMADLAVTKQHILELAGDSSEPENWRAIHSKLEKMKEPFRAEILETIGEAILQGREEGMNPSGLIAWKEELDELGEQRYNTHLYNESSETSLNVPIIPPVYSDSSVEMPGFEVLNRNFDKLFEQEPLLVAFGEDVGKLGDVNQGLAGLQEKHGKQRIFDTGIREATIVGQAIGLAARGLRPIAEIQYLDYFLYGLQTLSDDLATLQYRTAGGQKAPAIIRTRGHRLEGVWHAGSPMGMIIHALRGMHVLVPRNMTQAAGFYNTLIQSQDPAVVVEVLNAYRLKERCPDNLAEFTVPLGVPEVLQQGTDITVVTYGACCAIALKAAKQLAVHDISLEVIDVQSLLPFDLNHIILDSLKKTNRIIFLDEDVPGGATAYMMQQVMEIQGGYFYLDSKPVTLCSHPHRPAYGTDGDYFSKPQVEHVVRKVFDMMNEADPGRVEAFY